MQILWYTLLVWGSLLLMPAVAVAAPASGGAVFGVVPADAETAQGLEVAAVAPGSPAERGGLQAGDILLSVDGKATRTRRDLLAAILARKPGDTIAVRYLRDQNSAEAIITLAARQQRRLLPTEPTDPGYKEHGDRMVKLLHITPELLEQMRELKREIRLSLASLPGDFAPQTVSSQLQQLRDLARDAQAHRHGWMTGRACEAYLQFHDDEGTLVLHGANNKLTIEVYDSTGHLQQNYPINTEEERQALPPDLLRRLQDLR